MKETCAAATEAAELSKTVTLHDLGLAAVKRRVFTVSADEPALHAFERMIHVGVSAAAVVTDDDTTTGGGEVVGNLSASDVRGVLPDRYGALTQPLTQYLALVRASSFPVVSYSSPRHHREQHPHHHSEGGGGVSAFTPHSSITRRHRSSSILRHTLHFLLLLLLLLSSVIVPPRLPTPSLCCATADCITCLSLRTAEVMPRWPTPPWPEERFGGNWRREI